MRINCSRVRSVTPYLVDFAEGDRLHVALRLTEQHVPALIRYGFSPNPLENTMVRVPRAINSQTTLNADGGWIVHRDLPKVPRTFERDYHCVDWHGNDHFGTCFQTRDCYPRTRVLPQSIELSIENRILVSPLFVCHADDFDRIRLTINMFLEMFGECETLTEDLAPRVPPVRERILPWTLLPVGDYPWERIRESIRNVIDSAPRYHQNIIAQRHQHIYNHEPDALYIGDEGFWGYVVYAFPTKNLYVFESNRINNATYVFRGNWEEASRLTKAEIIGGNLQDARIIHTEQWAAAIHRKLNE